MEDLNDKINGGTLDADEWNQPSSEIQNIIESQGIVLSNADLNQLGKALAGYIANGHFYTDSGIANAYVLTTIGTKQNAPSLTDGFTVSFIPGNDSTGASTANVGGFGVKDIKRPDGTAVQAGDIADRATLVYDDGAGYFVLFGFVPDATTTNKGIIETATNAEAVTGTDTIRATTPAGVKAHVDDRIFPSGTTMLFVQAAAPTGWTKSVTHNNKALRIVNTSGGGSAGSNTFTGVLNTSHSHTVTVNSHVLTESEMPAHTHSVHSKGFTGAAQDYGHTVTTTLSSGGTQTNTSGNTSGAALTTGGGSGHVHTGTGGGTNLDVQYVDSIICVKD